MSRKWLQNATVIISGASGGLGFAITKRLIDKYNCKVIGIARNEEKLLKNREALGDKKDNFTYRLFDVTVKQNWIDFANWLQENGIIPNLLINNAGFMLPFQTFDKTSDDDIDEIIKTNLTSYVYSTKILLPLIKQSQKPAIVNICSAAGLCPVVGESMYCLTKYGLRGFTETLQLDYKKQVYIGGVFPGFIRTDLLKRMDISEKNNGIIDKLMMPVEKASKKIVKGIARRKKRIVTGLDGKSMHLLYRMFPKKGPALIRWVLKITRLEMFTNIFDYKEKIR